MAETKIELEADYAMTLHPTEEAIYDRGVTHLNQCWNWTGWTTNQWPASIIRPKLKIYKFDKREDNRRLCALLELTHGGTFKYRSMQEFADEVFNLTQRRPDPNEDNDSEEKWADVRARLQKKRCCIGICCRWTVIRAVSIPLKGQLPRVGWIKLRDPDYGMRL